MSRERGFLTCSECGADVTEGHANIMVNAEAYTKQYRYTGLRVICKPCTARMDDRGDGKTYHSIWELYSVRDAPLEYLGYVLREFVHPTKNKWDTKAVDSFVDILIELLSRDDAEGLLRSFFASEEWDGERGRLDRFHEHRDKGREREKRIERERQAEERIEREKRAKEKPMPFVKTPTDIDVKSLSDIPF